MIQQTPKTYAFVKRGNGKSPSLDAFFPSYKYSFLGDVQLPRVITRVYSHHITIFVGHIP
jgi:hypothetical protein